MNNETEKAIINMLSALLLYEMRTVAREQRHPQSNADEMDDIIKRGKEKTARLRWVRKECEDIFTGVFN